MNNKTILVVADPQNDFCDIPENELPVAPESAASGKLQPLARPALPVAGGDADMKRLAALVSRMRSKIDAIYVTLDSHHPVDIAHPSWWCNAKGESPAPFTTITADDLKKGVWRARDPALHEHSIAYTQALEAMGRYQLVVWPEHCLIGSWGHNVHSAVKKSFDQWARERLKQVNYIFKGTNPKTEHYSAIRAEVPDSSDPSTLLNVALLERVVEADTVLLAGEALSHCVANTVRDIANNIGEPSIKKLVLLKDCASSVPGFEKFGDDFVAELTRRGMRTAISTELRV